MLVADLLMFLMLWSGDESEKSATVMVVPRLFLGMVNGSNHGRIIKMKLRWSLWFGGEAAYFRVANREDACEMCYGGISSWWMAVESVTSSTGMDDGLAPDWYDSAFW